MNKDEIDLSAYPSYLSTRLNPAAEEGAVVREAVVRGLVAAALVAPVGVALGVAISRQTIVPVNIDMFTGAVTSGAMVLLYARAAGTPPRRGLVPLLILLLSVLVLSFAAILLGRAWWVYTLLDDELGMPMSRSSFIWGMFADGRILHWNLIFPFTLSSISGSCLALWKVRRRDKR